MKYFEGKGIPKSRLARWNRRQRKKLRVGEFQELGFTLTLKFIGPLETPALDGFVDAFCEYIASIGLCVCGLGGTLPVAETDGFIASYERGTVTPELRAEVVAWCKTRSEVVEAGGGELIDAWHQWGWE